MKAIILAAGRGSRLKGLTEDRPKCLNYIGGRTILERQIMSLKSAGIRKIIIVAGYKAPMLEKLGFKTYKNAFWEKTSMFRSLLCAKDEFFEQAIVSYSDICYPGEIVSRLVNEKKDITVVYDEEWKKLWQDRFEDPLLDAESFKINHDKKIVEIGKKPRSLGEIEGQYTGLMSFTPEGFRWILDFADTQKEEVLNRLDMTSLLQSLIMSGYPVYGMPIKGDWCEIDTRRDLELANRLYGGSG